MTSTQSFAKAEMLIRKPVQEVFEAFTNPDVTTKIWFTKSSGALEEGKSVEWTWEMYNVTIPVMVRKLVANKQILIEWGNYQDLTTVEWTFKELPEGTFVSVINAFPATDPDKTIAMVRDSTEGFTLVLAGLKALLEHGVVLNLVGDRFPKSL